MTDNEAILARWEWLLSEPPDPDYWDDDITNEEN